MSGDDLAIIIVSYNVRELLRRCLVSLDAALAQSTRRARIIVVDNASEDGSPVMVAAEFPHVQLLALEQNLGFAGGNNVGLRWLGENRESRTKNQEPKTKSQEPGNQGTREPGNHELISDHQPPTTGRRPPITPAYVLLLNPDTEVVGAALDQLIDYLEAHPEAVVVGPQLRYGDGTLQSSRRRFPTIGALFWESTLLELWWPTNPWAQRYRYADCPADGPQMVDWLVGAALLVRWSAIARAGLLDEGFFMYSEELEWQERLGRHGAIVHLPDALIVHYEGKSSEQHLARRHINFSRSKLRYAQRRWGRAVAWPLRGFLLVTYGVQLLIEAGKWLLGHKRALRRQRIVQYRTILRSGL